MNNSFKFATTATLFAALGLLGTAQPAQGHRSSEQGRRFTGEQIFRGVIFGDAPVSHLFPEIWATKELVASLDTKTKIVAWNDLKEEVVAQVISNDASFMRRFGQAMQSGNRLTIQGALSEAGQHVIAAMQTLGYVDANGVPLAIGAPQADCLVVTVYAALALYYVAAAAVVSVAVAARAVVLYEVRVYPKSPAQEEQSRLFAETLINAMAERLYAQ